MNFSSSSFKLGIGGIGGLLVAGRSINDESSWVDTLQLVVANVALLSCSIDKISRQVGVKSPSFLLPKQDYELGEVFSFVSAFL